MKRRHLNRSSSQNVQFFLPKILWARCDEWRRKLETAVECKGNRKIGRERKQEFRSVFTRRCTPWLTWGGACGGERTVGRDVRQFAFFRRRWIVAWSRGRRASSFWLRDEKLRGTALLKSTRPSQGARSWTARSLWEPWTYEGRKQIPARESAVINKRAAYRRDYYERETSILSGGVSPLLSFSLSLSVSLIVNNSAVIGTKISRDARQPFI